MSVEGYALSLSLSLSLSLEHTHTHTLSVSLSLAHLSLALYRRGGGDKEITPRTSPIGRAIAVMVGRVSIRSFQVFEFSCVSKVSV